MLNGKSLLITGGTGSFGKEFVKTVLHRYPEVKRLVIFSRDELKQFEMAQLYPANRYPQMRFFLGDVRDINRLHRALEGIDIVIHAAALKQVPAAEYNPFECIKTNILGAQNLIEACLDSQVSKVIALSTDKAAAPINLYGATKLCSDKLFAAANAMRGAKQITFSAVRYGNVMGSRGSVIPFFMKQRTTGTLTITDKRMTRFNITLQDGINFVLKACAVMWGGEIFVPKIPSYNIMDVAEAIGPGCRHEIVGIRPGEKLHEEMITQTDALNSLEFQDYFVILPSLPTWNPGDYLATYNGTQCAEEFRYASNTNTEWLSVDELRDLIKTHIDPDFKPA